MAMDRRYPDLINDLAIVQGETYRQLQGGVITLEGDWSSADLRGHIRDGLLEDDGLLLAIFEFDASSYDAGSNTTTINPYLPENYTVGLAKTAWKITQPLKVGRLYVYDLEAELAGEVKKLSFGFVQVIGEVTDNAVIWNPPIFWDGSVDHISLTATNGLINTYTVWGDGLETLNLGTFDVEDGNGIVNTVYNPDYGSLTLTYEDGYTFTTGDIRGEQGVKGDKGDKGDIGNTGLTGNGIVSTAYNAVTGVLTITYDDGSTYSTGVIRGEKGDIGLTGNGISSSSYDAGTGVLTLTFTDATTYSTGDLRGVNGTDGIDGVDATALETIIVSLSDNVTPVGTGTSIELITLRYNFTVTGVWFSTPHQAPTGSAAIVRVLADAVNIFTSVDALTIPAASTTVGPLVPNTSFLATGTVLRFDIQQVGATDTGLGYRVTLQGTRS